jgi:epoxyqueuosine reductase
MTAPDKDTIRAFARGLGFDPVRFARAEIADRTREEFAAFLAEDRIGDMGWLREKADRRSDPRVLWPEAKSVIMVGLNYAPQAIPQPDPRTDAAVSVYAQGRDYHDVVKSKLKQLARWLAEKSGEQVKVFVDTAPVMEKPLAHAAGLGWQGKHTNLVSREFGSWLFLGEVFTTIEIEPDAPERDHCGVCRACVDACPTKAFAAPYRLDPTKCISYLTIEHKGPIPRSLRPLMGNRIYGCDDCLAACPWNKFARAGREAKLQARGLPTSLETLAALDDAAFRQMFSGSPVKRTGRDRFVRNVLIAIGNSGNPALLSAVRERLADSSPLVRGAAVWAFRRLATAGEQASASGSISAEPDPQVREEWTAGDVPAAF